MESLISKGEDRNPSMTNIMNDIMSYRVEDVRSSYSSTMQAFDHNNTPGTDMSLKNKSVITKNIII